MSDGHTALMHTHAHPHASVAHTALCTRASQSASLSVIWSRFTCTSLTPFLPLPQINWHGADRVKFIEKVVCGDIQALAPGEGKLSLIMNDRGGIVDDTVIR